MFYLRDDMVNYTIFAYTLNPKCMLYSHVFVISRQHKLMLSFDSEYNMYLVDLLYYISCIAYYFIYILFYHL